MQLMKSKLLFGLVATVLLVGMMASTATAQVSITLYPNASAEETASNRNALTNDRDSVGSGVVISGALLAAATVTLTNIVLDYSAAITSASDSDPNPGAIPTGDALRLEGATGVFATSTITTVDFVLGKVTISMPSLEAASVASGSMRLIGVRVDASATTAPVTVSASISNSAQNYILATSGAQTVITSLSAGLGSAAIGVAGTNVSSGKSTVFTNAVIGDATSSIVITEGFATAWRTATQESNSGTALAGSGTQITLTFTGIPTGMTLTGVVTNVSTGFTAPTIGNAAVTSATDNVMTFTLVSTSLTKIESFDVVITTTVAGTTSSFTAGSITAVGDLAPIGAALSSATATNNYATATGGYPRFLSAPSTSFTVVDIVASKTNLLVPYLVSDGTYDTGIVIANTTLDPWSGSGGAVATAGAITLTMYPRTATGIGTAITLTTSATAKPGVGLDATGQLVAGGTWSVLLTELMTAASQASTVFTGYVFIQTDFLLAHGISFVSDFTGPFTSFSPMMALEQTEVTARTGFESLSF